MFARRFIALVLSCVWGFAAAQTAPPVDGIYWDPHQSGRGYAVETQDDLVFIAIYNYDDDGSPTFYSVQGTWNPTARRVDGARLLQVSSGPWIGGPFSPIGGLLDRGPVTFEFPTFTTARFTFNGQTSNLQRFLFRYGANADSLMAGTWFATFGGLGAYFGELVGVSGSCTISACDSIPEAFAGARIDGGTERVLVGGRQDDGRVFFLLDSSTNYYELFVYELRVNEWVGFAATFLKGDNAPDSGLLMFGHRLTGPSFFRNAAAANPAMEIGSIDAMKAAASARAAPPVIDGKAIRTDDIRAMVPALKRAIEDLR